MNKIVVLAVALAAFSACMSARWGRLQPGMSKKDVVKYVGEPRKRIYDDNLTKGAVETWFYDYYNLQTKVLETYKLQFDHERLTWLKEDPERLVEIRKTQDAKERAEALARIVPPDVGFRCLKGTDCKSGHCFEGKCAGPRDCTRPVGSDCLTDLDCCSMKCSQMMCRER